MRVTSTYTVDPLLKVGESNSTCVIHEIYIYLILDSIFAMTITLPLSNGLLEFLTICVQAGKRCKRNKK
jgi:hypothetical protein